MLTATLPRYRLIEKIRIHDFHRFGIVPQAGLMFQGGPVKLKVRAGRAVYSIPSTGPQSVTTGDAKVEEQRPLLQRGYFIFDDEAGEYVSLIQALGDYLSGVPKAVAEFEKLVK